MRPWLSIIIDLTHCIAVKLINKLLGEKDVEDVLHRLDRLTLDEARDTAAQTLEVVYGLAANMRLILDGEGTLSESSRTIERPSTLGGEATADRIQNALGKFVYWNKQKNKLSACLTVMIETMQGIARNINKSQRELFPIITSSSGNTDYVIGEKLLRCARKWIHPPDPWENHNAARESHHRGTSTWFVQKNSYTKWKSSRDLSGSNSYLWIHAKRG
jgi:hypothetical protein